MTLRFLITPSDYMECSIEYRNLLLSSTPIAQPPALLNDLGLKQMSGASAMS